MLKRKQKNAKHPYIYTFINLYIYICAVHGTIPIVIYTLYTNRIGYVESHRDVQDHIRKSCTLSPPGEGSDYPSSQSWQVGFPGLWLTSWPHYFLLGTFLHPNYNSQYVVLGLFFGTVSIVVPTGQECQSCLRHHGNGGRCKVDRAKRQWQLSKELVVPADVWIDMVRVRLVCFVGQHPPNKCIA